MNYNELSKMINLNAVEKGFWPEGRTNDLCLMLVITEISEVVEADRKGRRANVVEFSKPEILPASVVIQNAHFINRFEKYIKDTVEDELADAFIRLLDLAYVRNINICFDETPADWFGCLFPESAYYFVRNLIDDQSYGLKTAINCALSYIVAWSKHIGFDLEFHIEQKIKYNSMREFMHGKKY